MKLGSTFKELGGHIILRIKPDTTVKDITGKITSETGEKLISFWEAINPNFDILFEQEIFHHQNTAPASLISSTPSNTNFDELTINRKKVYLQKRLLTLYKKATVRHSALRINWNRVNIIGWPVGIPYSFASIATPQF